MTESRTSARLNSGEIARIRQWTKNCPFVFLGSNEAPGTTVSCSMKRCKLLEVGCAQDLTPTPPAKELLAAIEFVKISRRGRLGR